LHFPAGARYTPAEPGTFNKQQIDFGETAPAEPAVTELVGRLRRLNPPDATEWKLCRDAADTITRLEADDQAWRDRERFLETTIAALQSERDRLREALDEIIPSKLTIAHAAKS
jgi:hypothetical protein